MLKIFKVKVEACLDCLQLGENRLNKNMDVIRLGDFRSLDIGFVLGDKSVEGKSCELEMTT